MKKADKYKELFSKEYLMGPNSMRLLEEMLKKYPHRLMSTSTIKKLVVPQV